MRPAAVLDTTSERRALVLLTASLFVSSIGTTLLLVGASATYLQQTGSAVSSSLVYVAQFLPSVAFASVVSWACRTWPARPLLVTVEGASLVVSVTIGALFGSSYWLVLSLFIVRGFFDTTMKAGRAVAMKQYSSADRLARGNTILNAGYYSGAAVGAILGAALLGRISIFGVSIVNACTFAIAMALYAGLPGQRFVPSLTVPEQTRSAWRRTSRALARDPQLARVFLYLVAGVGLLQGVNQILRVWIPIEWLGMPTSGAAVTEFVGLAAVITGVTIVGIWFCAGTVRRSALPLFFGSSVVALLLTMATRQQGYAFSAYFGYIMAFELVYTICLNEVLLRGRHEDMPYLMAAFYGSSFALMSVVVIVVGQLVDQVGLPPVLLAFGPLSIAVVLTIESTARRIRRAAAAPG